MGGVVVDVLVDVVLAVDVAGAATVVGASVVAGDGGDVSGRGGTGVAGVVGRARSEEQRQRSEGDQGAPFHVGTVWPGTIAQSGMSNSQPRRIGASTPASMNHSVPNA